MSHVGVSSFNNGVMVSVNNLVQIPSHYLDNITEGFRRVQDSIVTVRVKQAQTFKKQSFAFGGGGSAA